MRATDAARTLRDAAWWAVLVWFAPATAVAQAAASCAPPDGATASGEDTGRGREADRRYESVRSEVGTEGTGRQAAAGGHARPNRP